MWMLVRQGSFGCVRIGRGEIRLAAVATALCCGTAGCTLGIYLYITRVLCYYLPQSYLRKSSGPQLNVSKHTAHTVACTCDRSHRRYNIPTGRAKPWTANRMHTQVHASVLVHWSLQVRALNKFMSVRCEHLQSTPCPEPANRGVQTSKRCPEDPFFLKRSALSYHFISGCIYVAESDRIIEFEADPSFEKTGKTFNLTHRARLSDSERRAGTRRL